MDSAEALAATAAPTAGAGFGQSVGVPPPDSGIHRSWFVRATFLGTDSRQKHTGIGQWDEGQLVRLPYDEEMPDYEAYEVKSIIELSRVRDRDWGVSLDQPILAKLHVTAISHGPPPREYAGGSASRVREREPEPESWRQQPKVCKQAGDDRGEGGESPLEGQMTTSLHSILCVSLLSS